MGSPVVGVPVNWLLREGLATEGCAECFPSDGPFRSFFVQGPISVLSLWVPMVVTHCTIGAFSDLLQFAKVCSAYETLQRLRDTFRIF